MCAWNLAEKYQAFGEPRSEAFRTAASHGLACAPQVAAQAACLAAQALLLDGWCECRQCRLRLQPCRTPWTASTRLTWRSQLQARNIANQTTVPSSCSSRRSRGRAARSAAAAAGLEVKDAAETAAVAAGKAWHGSLQDVRSIMFCLLT